MLSLFPISDANPTRTFPVITILLIAANAFVFLFVQPDFGSSFEADVYFVQEAPIPCQIEGDCPDGLQAVDRIVEIPDRTFASFVASSVFSTFLHAGWLHIIGNMLFLWVFGNNVEDYLGKVKFVLFYLAGGLAATFAHVFTHLDSVAPGVGASGAVAAVMGAYLLLFPKARVNVLVTMFIFITVIQLSAIVVLGIWFAYQFLYAYQEATVATGVAWMAHVGGFVFGLVGIFLLGGRPHRAQPAWEPRWGRSGRWVR
ncbi:MAG TPA: rhomboid family intramembrane serine protease [Actinomycetota bacterium]|nr:rhomboid family intramembrane serine protease [Actinomycetota bacterium]